MRVISQCGRGDFPYEQISLVIRNFGQPDQWLIVAHGLYFKDDLGTRIAEYSTEEKARKAIDLLHETYIGKKIISVNADVDFHESAKKLLKNTSVICTPCADVKSIDNGGGLVFKFPKDEEIEVVD